MNAIQLADELQARFTKADYKYVKETATMLRQQQVEIESLKKLKAEMDAIDKKLYESIKKSNELWDKAADSILKKAKKNANSN
jgi:hypothetical protein